MNKRQLVEVLKNLAKEDLASGSNLNDHPCMIAIRALDECFSDIEFLKKIVKGDLKGNSKVAQTLLKLKYDPAW